MIPVNNDTLAALKTGSTIKAVGGCTFEYNMNYVGETLTTQVSVNNYQNNGSADLNYPATTVPGSPFKKLFPIDTIKKQFRPESAGIKYAIVGDIAPNTTVSPKRHVYNPTGQTGTLKYRTYYPGQDTAYKYWVSGKSQNVDIKLTYPKTILVNKVVIKLETSHSIPVGWTLGFELNGNSITGTSSTIGAIPENGVLTVYYTGSGWTLNESLHNKSAYISANLVKVYLNSVQDKYIGVIEISPRYEIDVSQYLTDFTINKESSSSAEDLLPVGKITANSLSMNLTSFDPSIKFKTFDKSITSLQPLDVYLFKNLIIKPYVNIYQNPASSTFEKVKQGTYYLHSYTISEHGELSLTALDSSKILQETISPNILCEGYTISGIIRYLLDSIGFTNYNINFKNNTTVVSGSTTTVSGDTSIITPNYWWTEDDKTVWDSLQELCRDAQMTAFFDENNILQFYTRDYLFDQTRVVSPWEFRQSSGNGYSSNIISLDKEETPSSSSVKIVWSPSVTSEFDIQNSDLLWQSSEEIFLGGGALVKSLNATETDLIELSPILPNKLQKDVAATTSLAGYFALDDEIIEFEGAEYRYKDYNNVDQNPVIIKTKSELEQIKSVAKPGTIFPTNRFKIKTRGALGTVAKAHIGTGEPYSNMALANGIIEWEVTWG